MKSYIYMLIFTFTLLSTPIMAAPPNPDPELDVAYQALDAATTTPRDFHDFSCQASSGGSYMAIFREVPNGTALMIQAEGGRNPRWQIIDQFDGFGIPSSGEFTSKGSGFQPWKKYVKNLCVLCISDPSNCLSE